MQPDKVTVVFPMRFKDSIDIAFATSFLQVLHMQLCFNDLCCFSEIVYMWATDDTVTYILYLDTNITIIYNSVAYAAYSKNLV